MAMVLICMGLSGLGAAVDNGFCPSTQVTFFWIIIKVVLILQLQSV